MVEPSKQKLRSIFSMLEKEQISNLRNKTKMKQKIQIKYPTKLQHFRTFCDDDELFLWYGWPTKDV